MRKPWFSSEKTKCADADFQKILVKANAYLRELNEPESDPTNHCAGQHGKENSEVVAALRAYENERVKQTGDLYKHIWAFVILTIPLSSFFAQSFNFSDDKSAVVAWAVILGGISAVAIGLFFIAVVMKPEVEQRALVQAVVDAVWKHRDK